MNVSNNRFSKHTNLSYLKNAILNPDPDKCILWPFAKTKGKHGGYGQVKVSVEEGGKGHMVTSHRAAFFFHYGYWPEPCGLHSCDNPPCFNPLHITAGTRSENTADCIAKGRFRTGVGVRNANSKLNPDLVRKIRSEYVYGSHFNSFVALGQRYGVRPYTIQMIIHRTTWKDV